MKMSNFQFKIALLLAAAIFISCSQKEVADEPDVRKVPTADVGAEQEVNPVIEQITVKNSDYTQEPEESPSESVEVNSTATNPETQEIRNYEPLSAQDSWVLIGGVTGDNTYKVFVDPRTIVKNNGLIESWSKLEFDETQSDEDGLTYKQVQIQSSIDCENRTYSYTDSKFYDGLGRIVESQPTTYEPKPVIEGTVSAKIADYVCGYDLNQTGE